MMRLVLSLCAALAFAACGSIEESEPKPRLDALSVPGTDFGRTLVGTRKRLDFQLRNSDAGFAKVKPLDVSGLTVTGGTLTSTSTCATLPFTPSASVSFSPWSSGTHRSFSRPWRG